MQVRPLPSEAASDARPNTGRTELLGSVRSEAKRVSLLSGPLHTRPVTGRKSPSGARYTRPMSATLDLTILYEDGEQGWIVASIPAVPGALSQGRSREEARENVL